MTLNILLFKGIIDLGGIFAKEAVTLVVEGTASVKHCIRLSGICVPIVQFHSDWATFVPAHRTPPQTIPPACNEPLVAQASPSIPVLPSILLFPGFSRPVGL